jgi:hypothetical protein
MTCHAIAVLALLLALAPEQARAYATFEVEITDDPGEGFNDMTAVAPVGGNMGTTRGEQRLNALRYATELWGEAIDSEVPIRISASFDPIECAAGVTTLALGGSFGLDVAVDAQGEQRLYPTALADRIMGEDLWPGEPDINIQFNSNVDDGCIPGVVWYYGLDRNPGVDSDMIDTALHEIGHGLGFQALYDTATGALVGSTPSAFMANVRDLDTGKGFHEMTDAERLASQVNVRRVAWVGPETTAAAAMLLERGMPSLSSAQVPELSGELADASFGSWPLAMSVNAELFVPPAGVCPETAPEANGRVVLLRLECSHSSWAQHVTSQGAVAVIVERETNFGLPPLPLDDEPMPGDVTIPVISVGFADIMKLETAAAAGTVTLALTLDEDAPLGADADNHVMLHVTETLYASSMSHFEQLARPSLLMEPITTPRELHDLDLTPALMHDLGWLEFCGNETLEQEEECDEGADNSDEEPDACRSTCVDAHCGDGVVDMGEACDDGEDNSDTQANACRTTCEEAACGDGVVDTGEACDDGTMNSGTAENACRPTCVEPSCGDGVMDTGEACDDGAMNSDTFADACRLACTVARCGDGVTDDGEACDDGAMNSDAPNAACRTTCVELGCGDGVLDMGESCDPGLDSACKDDCQSIDPSRVDGGMGMNGGSGGEAEDEGCGCRALGAQRDERAAWPVFALIALAAGVTRRSRARARMRKRAARA